MFYIEILQYKYKIYTDFFFYINQFTYKTFLQNYKNFFIFIKL